MSMDIEKLIDDKTKDICETMEECVKAFKSYISMGIDKADTEEVGEVADIIKDLSETYCNVVKAIYHKQITIAMENSEYGEDYDYKGKKYYTDANRVRNGTSEMEYYRDMDRKDKKMYYTEPSMNDSRMGRSASKRVRYFESKNSGDKSAQMESVDEYFDGLDADTKEMFKSESPEIKAKARQRMMNIANALV